MKIVEKLFLQICKEKKNIYIFLFIYLLQSIDKRPMDEL